MALGSQVSKFKIRGRFWVPGREANALPGTVSGGPDKMAILKLRGVLLRGDGNDRDEPLGELETFTIYGRADNGQRLTLLGAMRTGSVGSTTEQKYCALILLRGVHQPDAESVGVDRVEIECSHFGGWIEHWFFSWQKDATGMPPFVPWEGFVVTLPSGIRIVGDAADSSSTEAASFERRAAPRICIESPERPAHVSGDAGLCARRPELVDAAGRGSCCREEHRRTAADY